MKFRITMKSPDAYGDALNDAAKEQVNAMTGVLDDDMPDLVDRRYEALDELCSQWFKYSEYVTIEIDTEAKTATVLKAA